MSSKENKSNKSGAGEARKLLVVFPGIGYTCDKPLLYYTKKLALSKGYDVVDVPYGNFGSGIFNDAGRIAEAITYACSQAEELLADVDFHKYTDVVFASKSIGTCVAARFNDAHGLNVRHIFYTPIEASFEYIKGVGAPNMTEVSGMQSGVAGGTVIVNDEKKSPGVMFHGTKDPWCSNECFNEAVPGTGLKYHLIEGGNHSLETGDVATDISNVKRVMEIVDEVL